MSKNYAEGNSPLDVVGEILDTASYGKYEVGYPDVDVIGLYRQDRDDGRYSFYIDIEIENGKVVDFWKDDNEYDESKEY